MAVLDISEYTDLARSGTGHLVETGIEPAYVAQQVSITGASVQSAAFQEATRFVRLHTDLACRVTFGPNPTAAGTSARLAANSSEFFGVRAGMRLAVIADGGGGGGGGPPLTEEQAAAYFLLIFEDI